MPVPMLPQRIADDPRMVELDALIARERPYRRKPTAHGTITAYGRGCRCQECLWARSNYLFVHRRETFCPPQLHGTAGAYTHYRCRCDRCRAAHAAAAMEFRKNKS